MKRWLLLLLVVGCKDEAKPTAATSTPPAASSARVAPTGSAIAPPVEDACAAYAKALDACVAKLPAGQRADLEKMRDQHAEAWKKASAPAREQMASTCQMGLATLDQDGRCK